MYKVVLDTNIYISSVFWEGKSYILIKKAIAQDIIAFISGGIIKEIRRALARDFNLEKQEIEDIVDAIALFTHIVEPKEKVDVIKEDPDDDRVLECALACKAKYIVSQDKHLRKLGKFRGIEILSPEQFLETV